MPVFVSFAASNACHRNSEYQRQRQRQHQHQHQRNQSINSNNSINTVIEPQTVQIKESPSAETRVNKTNYGAVSQFDKSLPATFSNSDVKTQVEQNIKVNNHNNNSNKKSQNTVESTKCCGWF